MKLGDIIEVRIPGAEPTGGWSWRVDAVDVTILEQMGGAEFFANEDPTEAGGYSRLLFKAVGVGKTNLSLVLAKEADAASPTMYRQTFGMDVEVW